MTEPRLYTPRADQVNALALAASLFGVAGIEHPTHATAAALLALIAEGLETVPPDDPSLAEPARHLAQHFHAWSHAVREAPEETVPITTSGTPVTTHTHALVPWAALHRLRYLAACAGRAAIAPQEEVGALREAAADLPALWLAPIRLALALQGGVVHDAGRQSPLPIEMLVADYDAPSGATQLVRRSDGQRERARVYAPPLRVPPLALDALFPPPPSTLAET